MPSVTGHPPEKLWQINFDKFKLTFGSCGLRVRVWLSTSVDAAHPMVINNVCPKGQRREQ